MYEDENKTELEPAPRKEYKYIKTGVCKKSYEYIEAEAKKYKISIARFLREKLGLALNDWEAKQIEPLNNTHPSYYRKVDPKFLYHLSKIGNNINQIARRVNSNDKNTKNILITLNQIKEELHAYNDRLC